MIRSALLATMVAAMVAAGPIAPASHANQVYTDQGSFLAALDPGSYLEDFDSLSVGLLTSPQPFSDGTFSYEASAAGGLFPFANPIDSSDRWLGPNIATDPLVFTTTSGNINAIGGFFFPTNFNGDPSVTTLTATLDNGDEFSVMTSSPTNFIGFTTKALIVSLTLSVDNGGAGVNQPFRWATANDLIVGSAAVGVIPEPGSIVLGGSGLALVGLAAGRRRFLRARRGRVAS